MEGVSWGFLKPEALVEGTRFFVRSVDNESSHPRLLRDSGATKHRVLKQRASDTLVLVSLIDCEAGQDHDGNRSIHRLALEHPGGRIGGLNLSNG